MRRFLLALTVALCACGSADAQLPQTRLYSIFPPGAAPGTITEIRVNTGADLDEVDRLLFNHPGIFATQKHKPGAGGVPQPVANTFRVAVEADVPPGRYEVRAAGLFGVSNPRPLLIDTRPTVQEAEPNNTAAQAQEISPGTLVNGQINGAGDIDYIRIPAKKGQRLVIDCLAERIDSRLNPMFTLLDADDKPIAFARNEYGRDPFLVFDVPADGNYLLKLQDETFAGGGEHIYRLQIHTGPHIRFAMPPAGLPGTTARVSLYGYNLPGSQRVEAASAQAALEKLDVDITIPKEAQPTFGTPSVAAGLDLFAYRHQSDAGISNTIMLGLASAPVVLEQEPNDEPAAAQKLTVPVELAGQSAQRGDVDRFTFDATKDQELWIEVIGQRGGVMIDPYLAVEQITVDDKGVEQAKSLTTQDDTAANLAANIFDTLSDDPAYKFKAPETGTYRLTLRDRASSSRGDPSLVYRLIIRPLRPDFRLVAVPSGQMSGLTWSVSPRRGDHFALDVLAFRKDGFNGPIEIRPLSLPGGITTQGTVIREKETKATLVLTASESASADLAEIRLVGSARITTPQGEAVIERDVRSGGAVWSRNGTTPAISRLESRLTATANLESAPYQLTYESSRTSVHQGRQLLLPMTLIKRGFDEKLTLKFDPAAKKAKVDAADVVFEKGNGQQTCRLFIRPDAPPGTYVIGGTSQAQVPYSRNPQKAERLAGLKTIAEQEARLAKAAADEAAGRLKVQVAALTQADAALKQAQTAQTAAQEKAKQAQQAVVTAKQTSDAAVKQVATLTEEAKQLTAKLAEATKAATDSEEDEAKALVEQAKKAADEKQAALKAAQQAQTQAQEKLTAAEATVKPATDALATAQQLTAQTQTAKQSAESLKAQLEAGSNAAAAAAKAKEAARVAAEKAATAAATAAKPKNVAVNQPIPPLILTIKPAPVALTAAPAKSDLKQGATLDVTITVKRQNEFAGPVKLTLPVPPGVKGLSAAEVTIAAEADSAVVKVAVTAETAEGDVPNLVIRAIMDAGGEAIVDVPISLKVTK